MAKLSATEAAMENATKLYVFMAHTDIHLTTRLNVIIAMRPYWWLVRGPMSCNASSLRVS